MQIFRQTGLNVRLGSLSPRHHGADPAGAAGRQHADAGAAGALANGRRVGLKNFDPCTILLNNDLSAGIPPILENIHEQTLLPPLHAGWAVRRKSNHLPPTMKWRRNSRKLIDVDPWMVNPYFAQVSAKSISMSATGRGGLAADVDRCCSKITKKYKEYGIKEKPFVIVKADAGTYGMGIMTVQRRERSARPEPQAAQQDVGRQGRAGGQRRDRAGRRADVRERSTTRWPSRWCT